MQRPLGVLMSLAWLKGISMNAYYMKNKTSQILIAHVEYAQVINVTFCLTSYLFLKYTYLSTS
jgi:uncharacterized membrane protein YagU involved in acid resistance